MTADAALGGLLRRLAAMPQANRAFVLDSLGQAEREALRVLLGQAAGTAMSSGLAQLVDLCRTGPVPSGMTARAAEALLAAVNATAAEDGIEEGLARVLHAGPARRRLFAGRRDLA